MRTALLLFAFTVAALSADPLRIDLLPPGPGNPRNTEGDFIELKDGRVLFAYTRFTGGGGDHDKAAIATRVSSDGGQTWSTQDRILIENEGGMNVMSVSFVRMRDGRIALFYVRKNAVYDCRPYVRFSSDEGNTWSEPILCINDDGYYVLNNDRVIQLRSGRILIPVALHSTPDKQWIARGKAMVYYSDDKGKTWRRSSTVLEAPASTRNGLQEPGLIELKDKRVMMYLRTSMGRQYVSYSNDRGDTWSPVEPSNIFSPLSPASIERIPGKKELLLVWNDHSAIDQATRKPDDGGKRTPFTVAISKDEGRTWTHVKNIETDPAGWYCYTAIEFVKGRVLLGYNAGGSGLAHLSRTRITTFPVAWLYQ